MSKCANCSELVGEEWSANNGLCSTCARDELSKADTNQASGDEVSLIPFETVVLTHMELAYESTDEARKATESVVGMAKALIRTEKLKLLAEVRGRVIGEDKPGVTNIMIAAEHAKQIEALTKLEAEL